MSARLIVAPAAHGKTAYAVNLARRAAEGLRALPMVVVATHLQARAWRRGLAEAGGAIGIRILTFAQLYAECLAASGEAYAELSEPVQHRLLRAAVDDVGLVHYAPLASRPGFLQVLSRLIDELKAARISPRAFAEAVEGIGGGPRLAELAGVYSAYQARLGAGGWADAPGLGWLAMEALEERAPEVGRDWPLVVVDGFDDLTPVQLELLRVLARRAGELVVTLSGTADGSRPQAYGRSERTRKRLEGALGVRAEALPDQQAQVTRTGLTRLEERLFRVSARCGEEREPLPVELVEAPERAGEVREALRWLKARLVLDGMRPRDVALLVRDVAPYRPFILQTAAEFGMPVRIAGGLPLRSNPAVAALLDLLRLVLPRAADDPQPALPRRGVVEAWRSPYFDWHAVWAEGDTPNASGADALDAAARWGRVIGGLAQWREVLQHLASRPAEERTADEEQDRPVGVPAGTAATLLWDRFERFVSRISPPAGPAPVRDHVRWLEGLIGPDPAPEAGPAAQESLPHLGMVGQVRAGDHELAERDVSALRAVKDVLRGLVWAEEALGAGDRVPYRRFFEELAGAVEAMSYQPPTHAERDEVVVADVVQARGVGFRAVALVGLAEGEFPAPVREDPFLRDADRQRMREDLQLELEPSTESAESEFFYAAVTRARERLLLTRPRLADGGAPWQASPFWEEVRRLVAAEPVRLTSESRPPPWQAASWSELMESLAAGAGDPAPRAWAAEAQPARLQALESAARVLRLRGKTAINSAFDGDLSDMAGALAQRFGPGHTWSASRLEAYRACPFLFFVGSVLGLEQREEPEEGLNVQQRGTLYHRILEQVYGDPRVHDPGDVQQLLAALPEVASKVLDAAPEKEGFRETAWWAQTRKEIEAQVGLTLEALAELPGEFLPVRFEARFGLGGEPQLVVPAGQDSFRLHGVIDRIDRSPDGRLRVIDYKSGSAASFEVRTVMEGKKLQLPLYAMAARDALRLGEPAEGFYWSVPQAKASPFRLSGVEGPQVAMRTAAEKAWEAVQGAREGRFAPSPPEDGCPAWCAARAFCWHYRPRFEG